MADQQFPAPELRVPYWLDAEGNEIPDGLKLADLGESYKLIFCFKAECPGCHSFGFPMMQKIVQGLAGKDFGFAVIHTAFDDDPRNSQDRIREMQLKYDLKIPFGHDPKIDDQYPTFMTDYGTRGTPFFILIDPDNNIIFGDFRINGDKVIEVLSQLPAV